MRIYNYSEARQNFTAVLNTALKEEVIITRRDGKKFKIIPIDKINEKSPLEGIKGVKVKITTKKLVETIREGREGRDYFKEKYKKNL
ncbi:MAG: type II toxin-antitoxin system Phd/YefM family antitoxin [Leptospirales bacterium]|nr:type II toxin-antitoxin system Phd/YefM family antitoxin [Leptospirales bacterium]